MRCLIVLLFFFTLITPISSTKTPSDPNSSRISPLTTPNLDKDDTIAALQAKLEDANKRLEELQGTLTAVQKKQEEVGTLNADLLAQKNTLEKTAASNLDTIQALKSAQTELEKKLATQQSKEDEQFVLLREELVTQKAALAKAQAELAAAQKDATETTSSSSDTQVLIAERDSLTTERDELAKEKATLTAQLKSLQADLEALQAKADAATGDDANAVSRIADLTEAYETLDTQKRELAAHVKELQDSLGDYNDVKQQYAEQKQQYAEQKQQLEDLRVMYKEATEGASQRAIAGHHIAQDQWDTLLEQVAKALNPVQEKLQQIEGVLPDLAKRITEVVSGRTVALQLNAKLRNDKGILDKRIKELEEFDDKFTALQKEKASVDAALQELTAAAKSKDENVSSLTAQLADLQTQLNSANEAMEELKTTEIAPAAQLRAQYVSLKQLMATLIGTTQRQMSSIGERISPLAECIESAKDHEKKLKNLERTLKALEDNVRELIDLAKQLSVVKRSAKSATDSSGSQDQLKPLQEQLATVTAQYNQLVQDANNRVQALQEQVAILQAKASEGSGLKDDVVRLQQQLDDEKMRRETDARIAQQIRDASVSAQLGAQNSALIQAQLDAQRDRTTDASTAGTQAMAGQAFATGIAAATKTAAPTGGLSLADLQAVFSRYGAAPTPQIINQLPTQYQPYMNSMAQLPQFKPMTTQQQVTYATTQLSQNRTTYIDTYTRAITFLQNPAARNNIGAFNSLVATVYNAVSREGYLWFMRGASVPRGQPLNTEARNNLRMLNDQVAIPLRNIKSELARQGVSDYSQPEDLVAKFTNFRRQLGEAI